MAITGQSGDGTCEVHGCQLERLRNEAQRLTEALTWLDEWIGPAGEHVPPTVRSVIRAALQSTEPLMTGPRPFQSSNGPVKAPPIPTEAEYRTQQKAKRAAIEARWAAQRQAKGDAT